MICGRDESPNISQVPPVCRFFTQFSVFELANAKTPSQVYSVIASSEWKECMILVKQW
jgi:hypothetical protein